MFRSIFLWNVDDALLNLKGILLNLHDHLGLMKVIYGQSSLLTDICQYPLARRPWKSIGISHDNNFQTLRVHIKGVFHPSSLPRWLEPPLSCIQLLCYNTGHDICLTASNWVGVSSSVLSCLSGSICSPAHSLFVLVNHRVIITFSMYRWPWSSQNSMHHTLGAITSVTKASLISAVPWRRQSGRVSVLWILSRTI